jgi:NAD(P)H dehydrogenase (quinone)
MTLALTGSTGRLGSQVARHLADLDPVLLVRDPARAPGHNVRRASYDEPGRALEGVTTLFMVSAAENQDRLAQHLRFLDAAEAAGVQQVVYTSFVAAAQDATFTLARDHWATEQRLRRSGMQWTFLRDQLYADVFPEFVSAGVLRGPAGSGRVAPVAVADVAEVAAAVLRLPVAHRGMTYDLTGPESLSFKEIADVLGVPYEDETVEQAHASRAGYHAEPWQVEAWVSTYLAVADGSMDLVTDDVEQLTGRPATPFAQAVLPAAPAD